MKRGKRNIAKKGRINIIKREIKNTKKEERIISKSIIITIIILLIALILLFLIFKNLILTTKVIEKPYTPQNCSNESIKKAWESIFKGSSENLTIVAPSQTFLNELRNESITPLILNDVEFGKETPIIEGCPIYTIYQINGSNVKMILGIKREMLFGTYGSLIMAINGKLGPSTIEQIKNISYNSFNDNTSTSVEWTSEDVLENETFIYDRETNITSIEQAKAHFESIFNINSSNWIDEGGMYIFYDNKTEENITLFGESINLEKELIGIGDVYGDWDYDSYMYTEYSTFGILEQLQEKYANWTSPINTSLKNITIQINNTKLDLLGNYEQIQKVKILENNQPVIETEINFTDNFDWTKIVLRKQDTNSTRGYVILNGLNYTKNITVDRLNNNSESVCIKDKEINSISEISQECNSTEEYILQCPGNISNFTCIISNNKFTITGLSHSAVIEIIPAPKSCISDWQCDDWTNFEKSCGYRTCTDLNNCGNNSAIPNETQQCPVCIPNWECSSFLPAKCPEERVRTRTCSDLNNCRTSIDEPSLRQNCEIPINWGLIIGGILVGIILLIIIIILIKNAHDREKKNPNPQEDASEEQPDDFPDDSTLEENLNKKPDLKNKDKTKDDDEYYTPQNL